MADLWTALRNYHRTVLATTHLRDLLRDETRCKLLKLTTSDLYFDYSHVKLDGTALTLLKELADKAGLRAKIQAMFRGDFINFTEGRAVGHVFLRDPAHKLAQDVLARVRDFTLALRTGELKGSTGKPIKNLVSVGIGGSYLGTEFVYEALRSHKECHKNADGLRLRFLANVDPIDFHRSVDGLDLEETLFLVNSKTFTTAQTMLNARACKELAVKVLGSKGVSPDRVVACHFCACSTNLAETAKFGIEGSRVFEFWDWVGGRFSVCSAIGLLPLSFMFGFGMVAQFLAGCHQVDKSFREEADPTRNLPLLLGLISSYQISVQGYSSLAIVPYSQPLCRFVAHIQQLFMESNGKGVDSKGRPLTHPAEVAIFGEPGTNSQHSFFQLIHQGRKIPVQFIGFTKSQQEAKVEGAEVSNHDELMSNFFSQPDALALGKTIDEVKGDSELKPHKVFEGDRPSWSLLFLGELSPRLCGMLLAIYEHKAAVEGFLWDVNSFDQWGVQLGKQLAKGVRKALQEGTGLECNPGTKGLFQAYQSSRRQA